LIGGYQSGIRGILKYFRSVQVLILYFIEKTLYDMLRGKSRMYRQKGMVLWKKGF
jgi:hypothetical protein